MKTNQVMKRPMGQFEVLQRTSDGYFDGSALLYQWNNVDENPRRRMAEFIDSPKTKEFLKALAVDESHRSKSDIGENQLLIKNKGRNTKDGKTADKVWMHPLLFIKFAMWINPVFEVQVLRFVYDQLISNRHLAGDGYNVLTKSIAKLPDSDYPQVAKALNYIVFGKHYSGIRNEATELQLKELHELEDKLAMLIDMDFVTNQCELIQTMRKMYNQKYQKF